MSANRHVYAALLDQSASGRPSGRRGARVRVTDFSRTLRLVVMFHAFLALVLPLPPRPGTTNSVTSNSVDVNETGSRIVNESK